MSVLPQAQRWNRLFQRHVTSSLTLTDDYFLRKWRHCEEHLDGLALADGQRGSFTALELGTGWFPVVPLGLALNGADRVWSVDIRPMLERGAVLETMRRYVHHAGQVRVPRPDLLERLDELSVAPGERDAAALLAEVGVVVRAADARSLDIAPGSVDLVVSNNTLEHIAGDVVLSIFEEFRRLATPTTTMSHFIDLTDHYSHFDKSITPYNFLRF